MTILFSTFLLTLLVITAVAVVRTSNLFVAVCLLYTSDAADECPAV